VVSSILETEMLIKLVLKEAGPFMKSWIHPGIASVMVLALLGSCILVPGSYAQTRGAESGNAGETESTFRTKCSGCHGADGSGNTGIGRTLKVPDLRSADVQKAPDAQLVDAIANGKNNRMPPFKSSLSGEQIRGLVQYIRQLPKSAN
jgi:mono/diheme cytochrome c family protein